MKGNEDSGKIDFKPSMDRLLMGLKYGHAIQTCSYCLGWNQLLKNGSSIHTNIKTQPYTTYIMHILYSGL